MAVLPGKTVFHKLWYILRTYILTLKRFDLFLQGSLLIIILLESNCYMLLRRDAGTGFLPAIIEDYVYLGSAGADFLLGSILAWWGRYRRNLALSAFLLLSATGGLLVLAFPYQESSPPVVELCGGNSISAYTETAFDNVSARMTLLITTAILCALTRISIWAHGLTYLDDHEPHNGPYYYGILISIRLSLGLSGQVWLRSGAFRDDWWEAHLSLSMLVLMFAILFTLFPKNMPNSNFEKPNKSDDFSTALARVLGNKVVLIQTCALVLLHAALFGFIRLDSKYVQAKFHIEAVWQDPRTSRSISDIFRALVVIFFVMIFRVRFSTRRSDGVKANTAARVGGVVAIFVAVFFAVLAILPCETGSIAGLSNGDYVQPACSKDCGCLEGTYEYTPVCDVDTSMTYFSPCSAGCSDYEDLNGFLLFHNCTCGSERMVRGSCTLPSCRFSFNLYQFFFTVVVAVSAAGILMQGMVILRAVRTRDKAIAIGATFGIVSLLAHGLGHALYLLIGSISKASHCDAAGCVFFIQCGVAILWTQSISIATPHGMTKTHPSASQCVRRVNLTCAYEGTGGATCVFHNPTLWTVAATSSVLALLSAIVSIIASKIQARIAAKDVIGRNNVQ